MSTLHTIAKSPDSRLLDSCQPLLSQGDAVLLLEDGVLYASRSDLLDGLSSKRKVYALREDINARGLQDKLSSQVEVISTRRFVQLCCDHKKVINWF